MYKKELERNLFFIYIIYNSTEVKLFFTSFFFKLYENQSKWNC